MGPLQTQVRRWIETQGQVLGPEFLRVDGFLNHRIDPVFVTLAAQGIAQAFAHKTITCVLTAEAAGNVIAYEVAKALGARALYAKKGKASTMHGVLHRSVESPTKGAIVDLCVSREYLGPGEHVLIVDDFLYRGMTSAALAEMVAEAGATLVGFAFIIEKRFGQGREVLASFGVPIVSLVTIARMDPHSGQIVFLEE
ncbi:MAG: phosphoribosyltransferase family protein [Candidatus Bipolaricaulaceae bacterium]